MFLTSVTAFRPFLKIKIELELKKLNVWATEILKLEEAKLEVEAR